MNSQKIALVIDDSSDWQETYIEILKRDNFKLILTDNEEDAIREIRKSPPNIAIVHFSQDTERSFRMISDIKNFNPKISIIYITYYGAAKIKALAIRKGAFTVISKGDIDFSSLPDIFYKAYLASLTKPLNSQYSYNFFVLMPFSKEFDDIYEYGIKQTVEKHKLTCKRVDEIQFTGNIIKTVFDCIENSDMILADMSGQNPNVFYEVGYAHAKNKPVILITNNVKDIPFDLRSQRHIIYNKNIKFLNEKIEELVIAFIENDIFNAT